MPPTVSPQNDVWETSIEIPYWWRVTTQIWVVTRHQYGISALVSQTSFGGKSVAGVAICQRFSLYRRNNYLSHKSIVQQHFWGKYSFQGVSNQVRKLKKSQGVGDMASTSWNGNSRGEFKKVPFVGGMDIFETAHFRFPFSLKLLHI